MYKFIIFSSIFCALASLLISNPGPAVQTLQKSPQPFFQLHISHSVFHICLRIFLVLLCGTHIQHLTSSVVVHQSKLIDEAAVHFRTFIYRLTLRMSK